MGAVLREILIACLLNRDIKIGEKVLGRPRVQVLYILVLPEIHNCCYKLVTFFPEVWIYGVDGQEVKTFPQFDELFLAHIVSLLNYATLGKTLRIREQAL